MKQKSIHRSLGTLIALTLSSPFASATTQLPYFGPDQKNCGIAYPSGAYAEIDAGFVSSEDCSYIYVLPPKLGNFEAQPVQFSVIADNACKSINDAIGNLLKINATPGTPEYDAALLRAISQVKNYTDLVNDSFPGVQAYASASASFDWNGLVRAYQEANPFLSSQFVAMPIRAGALSMAAANNKPGSLGEFENELYSVRVSSYTPPTVHAGGAFDPLPAYLSFIEGSRSSFLMGQSVGLELRFGIQGACGLAHNAKPENSLSGTYTYVYPVQSKGLVRYEFNKEVLVPVIRDYIRSHTERFTAADLAGVIKTKQAFNVIINEGAFPDSSMSQQLDEFKTTLATQATDIMLSLLASQSAVSMAASTTQVTNTHSETECHGAWFWKHCDTRTWYSTTSVVNWEQFANDLTRNLAVPELSAQNYRTFYIMSTSAIVPKKHSPQE